MATFVGNDMRFEINSVDLSDWVKSVTLDYSVEGQDETAMGDTTRINIGGLKAWSFNAELMQDYAASSVDVTLFTLIGTQVTVKFRPTSSSISSTNPEYSGTALITEYAPVGGSIGEIAMTKLAGVSAGNLSRATS